MPNQAVHVMAPWRVQLLFITPRVLWREIYEENIYEDTMTRSIFILNATKIKFAINILKYHVINVFLIVPSRVK